MKQLTTIVLFSSLCVIFSSFSYSKDSKQNWKKLNGKWDIRKSSLFENRGWNIKWKYYMLVDYNSVITTKHFKKFTSISYDMTAYKYKNKKSSIITTFAITSPKMKWFYHAFGFKFHGNKKGIKKVSLIYTNQKNKRKKLATKHNYFVQELASAKCDIDYGDENKYLITYNGKNIITLYINGKKILSNQIPENSVTGRIGFSSRNARVKIGHVKVVNHEVLLNDKFDSNTLYVPRIRVKLKRIKK